MAEQKSTVQSIERAVDILEFLYRKREEASIREISGETGLSGGTVHRILGTLRQRGFVYQNESNSKYWLGLKFYSYGDVVKENLPIVRNKPSATQKEPFSTRRFFCLGGL